MEEHPAKKPDRLETVSGFMDPDWASTMENSTYYKRKGGSCPDLMKWIHAGAHGDRVPEP